MKKQGHGVGPEDAIVRIIQHSSGGGVSAKWQNAAIVEGDRGMIRVLLFQLFP